MAVIALILDMLEIELLAEKALPRGLVPADQLPLVIARRGIDLEQEFQVGRSNGAQFDARRQRCRHRESVQEIGTAQTCSIGGIAAVKHQIPRNIAKDSPSDNST